MSAPDRIYLDGDAEAGDGYFTRCFETAKPCSEPAIEYVRANLCDPQGARVRALVEASEALLEKLDEQKDGNLVVSVGLRRERLRAALRALEQGDG